MTFTISEIAGRVAGEVAGDGRTAVTGLAAVENAGAGDLTFADKKEHFLAAESSAATAILVSGAFTSDTKTLVRVPNARIAVAKLLPLFFPPAVPEPGVDARAVVAPSAQVDPTAHVGPGCVIGENVCLGARSALLGGNYIGAGSRLGEDVCLHPNAVVTDGMIIGHRVIIHAGAIIGSDGYGYVFDEGRHRKVLQVGRVEIHDDVEIGANSAIDRGALGSTIIGAGTKIDNLVHIAHNVIIGRHCLLMAQVGIAGSTRLGDYTVIASQSGLADHLTIGRQATVGAKSGVMRDIPDGGTVLGLPAMPAAKTKRVWVAAPQLPEMLRRLRELEQQVKELQGR